jgi:hypothetical protein
MLAADTERLSLDCERAVALRLKRPCRGRVCFRKISAVRRRRSVGARSVPILAPPTAASALRPAGRPVAADTTERTRASKSHPLAAPLLRLLKR